MSLIGFDQDLPFLVTYTLVDPSYSQRVTYRFQEEMIPLSHEEIVIREFPLRTKPVFDLEKELIFFPGSFNPWHEGHQACLDLLPDGCQVVVIPDQSPFKDRIDHSPSYRYHHVEKNVNLTRFEKSEIYPGFLTKDSANPTYDWVKRLKTIYPDLKASLLIGHDSLESLPLWKNSKDLVEGLFRIYFVSRTESEEERAKALDKFKNPVKKFIYLGHHDFESVSSSSIRKQS